MLGGQSQASGFFGWERREQKTFENNKNFERWKIWHLKDLLVNWIQKSNQGSKIMARFLALGG